MRRGWSFLILISYVCLLCAGVCPAGADAAEDTSADAMLSENPSMFAEDLVLQLDEQNRDEKGASYGLSHQDDGTYNAILQEIDFAGYDTTQDHIEIRVPDLVVKDGIEYRVTGVGPLKNDRDRKFKIKFYLGQYAEQYAGWEGNPLTCGQVSFFVHPQNKCFTVEQGSLFDERKEALIAFYDGIYSNGGVYAVPQTVKKIGSHAFYGTKLEEVVLGDQVTEILYRAFGQARIRRINLNQVQSVGMYAFEQCGFLEEIILPQEGVLLGNSCFQQCNSLRYVYLPANTELGSECFLSCERLETVIMDDGCKFVNEGTAAASFFGCRSLKVFILPDTLEVFCWSTVGRCNLLKKLYIPSQLKEIRKGFRDSQSYEHAVTIYSADAEGPGKAHAQEHDNITFQSLEGHVHAWQKVTFFSMDHWGVVGNYCAECGCGGEIEKVTWKGEEDKKELPPLLETGTGTCPACSDLDDENKDEFGICYELDQIRRTAGITGVSPPPFHDGYWYPPSKVKKEGIEYTVERVGNDAFYGQRGLVLPDTVKELKIREDPLSDGLDLLVIGAGVKTIQSYAGLRSVGRIMVSGDNACFYSEDNVLYNKDRTEQICVGRYGVDGGAVFYVPHSVKTIGPLMRFEGFLRKVQIYNEGEVYIDNSAFFGEDVEIEYLEWQEPLDENNTDPDGRTYLLNENTRTASLAPADLSVYEGGKLTAPYKVQKNGVIYVVDGISLGQVEVLNTDKVILEIGKHISRIDFGTRETSKVYCEVDWENPCFRQVSGTLVSASRDTLYHFYEEEPGGTYQLPTQVEKIAAGAFRGAGLSAVKGGEQLTGIGDEAFAGCCYLESIKLGKAGLEIGDRVFSDCVRLKNMYLPKEATIGAAAFQNCGALQRVIMDQETGWGVSGNSGMAECTECYDYQDLEGHDLKDVTFFCFEDWGVKGKYCRDCCCGTEYEVVSFEKEEDRNRMPERLLFAGEIPEVTAEPPREPGEEATAPPEVSTTEPTREPGEEATRTPERPTSRPSREPGGEATAPPEVSTAEPPREPGGEATGIPEAPASYPTQRPTKPSGAPAPQPTGTPGEILTETAEPPTQEPAQSPAEFPEASVSPKWPGGVEEGDENSLLLQYTEKLGVTGFRVSSTKEKTAKLNWNRNVYAKCYKIYRATSKTGNYKLVKMVNQFRVSYVDEGVKARKKYFYKITALGAWGDKLVEGGENKICSFYTAGICTPKISVKKGRLNQIRYIAIMLEYYEGKNVEIYISQKNQKFRKLKLVSNRIARYKGKFKLKYMVKNQKIRFKVRTYWKIGKKRIYSKFSKVAGVRV